MTPADLLDGPLYGLGTAVGAGTVAALLTKSAGEWRLNTAGGLGLWLVVCVLQGQWLHAVSIAAVIAVLLAWDWWNRKGRKVARKLGAKSRAALAAVVARAREAGTPLPEGAGA